MALSPHMHDVIAALRHLHRWHDAVAFFASKLRSSQIRQISHCPDCNNDENARQMRHRETVTEHILIGKQNWPPAPTWDPCWRFGMRSPEAKRRATRRQNHG
jgi:hypothetical protein